MTLPPEKKIWNLASQIPNDPRGVTKKLTTKPITYKKNIGIEHNHTPHNHTKKETPKSTSIEIQDFRARRAATLPSRVSPPHLNQLKKKQLKKLDTQPTGLKTI